MDLNPVDFLSRTAHVLTAIILLGGSIFIRFVMMPAAAKLPDAEHNEFRGRIMGTWRFVVSAGIALLIVTGFYNYLVVALPAHKGDGPYHMLMGIKMLLALVVFFLASALTGRSKALEFIRRENRRWLLILVLLAIAVVVIASYLKVRGTP